MESLNKSYISRLERIKETLQNSNELAAYLDDESEESYKALLSAYESELEELHEEVATEQPLQIIALENEMLSPDLEGMFLPRILGYSVVRGDVNDEIKYLVPQDHFKRILLAICNSANFEYLKARIGQSIQVGFALSSDIWITSLLNSINNKKVKNYLKAQKILRLRDKRIRHTAYNKYKKQFSNFNFQYAVFPETPGQLKLHASALKEFLLYRSTQSDGNNDSLIPEIQKLLENESLSRESEYLELLMIIAMSYDLGEDNFKIIKSKLKEFSISSKDFLQEYFTILINLLDEGTIPEIAKGDMRISKYIDRSTKGELSHYYDLMEIIHGYGYVHEKSIEAVQAYYDQHPGLSLQNEALRSVIKSYFVRFLENLPEESYHDYIEMNKIFSTYMGIFLNEKFNQSIKHSSLKYVKRLLRRYTDKRAKDYQEIKKFVSISFVDMGFYSEKEVKDLFKTKRKSTKKA